MKQPVFSIVIANYNYGRFIGDAIESVLKQVNWGGKPAYVGPDDVELIICDGGSKDNSVEIIERYAKGLPQGIERSNVSVADLQLAPSMVSYWISEPDGGQSAAFNKGFSHAHGQFLVWLNADDVLMPGALRSIVRLHDRHPEAEWLTGSSVYVDKNLVVTDCFIAHKFSYIRARYGSLMVGGPSSFFSRRLLEKVGWIGEDLHYVMDLDLWMKFYKAGAHYEKCNDFIFAFRKHEDSKMSGLDVSKAQKAVENRRRAHEESVAFNRRFNKGNSRIRYWADLLTMSLRDRLNAWRASRSYVGKSVWSLYQKETYQNEL